jgi:diguanylate cyclase (GGDEF)-like protein
MTGAMTPAPPPRIVARLAVAGMLLAVVALGVLAVWAAIVTQNGAHGLTRAGVQTSGHLRAVQALTRIDTHTDALEEGQDRDVLRKLRRAQRLLDDALDRMEHGGVREASRIADEAKPVMARLKPAIERFLATPPGADSDGSEGAEEEMEQIMTELQVLLNDLDADPSRLLTTKLESVTASEHAVRGTAFVLVPLGLFGVAACGWLLNVYRRRSEATMREALELTAREARTDQLTGLPNRRGLLEEFERRLGSDRGFTLALADLNGFKRYNDTFGHPAGDALLRRLGLKLREACDAHGMAARLGGDEFCVLLADDMPIDEVRALLSEALTEHGDGFEIGAASGVATVPGEAGDASSALRLADARMYAAKVNGRPSVEHGMSVALTRMLDERHPGLGEQAEDVAELAVTCAEALGLSGEDIEAVERAARFHDLGKVAIPSSILNKRAKLTEEEWDFMRRHSVIGERILNAVSSWQREAAMVRASHERWDGTGYPDGVGGEHIPLGARIIAVADAFTAMTENRPYAAARSVEDALAELRACAGSQFEPRVVDHFLRTLGARASARRASAVS